jgi:hypothetical protein
MNPRPRSTPFEEMIGGMFGGGFNRYCGDGSAATVVIPITPTMPVVPARQVNEFYKKGCQEKSSTSTGGEILSRDPAHCSFTSLEKFGLFAMLVSSSAEGDGCARVRESGKRAGASEATTVLSEARGLGLFLVIRDI